MCPAVEAAPIVADAPVHIEALLPALFPGRGLTVIITEFELVQPVAVMVSVKVYVVVAVGETEGLDIVLVNPAGDETQE